MRIKFKHINKTNKKFFIKCFYHLIEYLNVLDNLKDEYPRLSKRALCLKYKPFVIYNENNKPIGIIGCNRKEIKSLGHLWAFYIDDNYRNQGYAKEVLQYFMNDKKLKVLTISSSNKNDITINLYEKMGFKFYDQYSKFESNYVYFTDKELRNQLENGLPMIDIYDYIYG